ncbi:IS5 family transposase [Microbulbifer sp. 2205BS26-8]|uniref:IS5 family transposase n=1 Tax=Microbulbifer sp. 2205BS26-8 TaxID=3064386 RepID=UPI00273D37F0|nr:IS5 family transposase [Microbulbifer sp. 2205BS26-8]MDP5211324.1 IS5 family transposase [Microbulbifer sp. 2205BS26-8]
MRGETYKQDELFSYVSLESRIPVAHPIRKVRKIVDIALVELDATFDEMYSMTGRPSIPPEQLIRALLLQILFTIRSERQLMERLDYDLMFRWFVGLGMDDKVWHPTVFTKNRDRVMTGNVDELFFDAIKKQAYAKKLMSRDHFSVDGTLLEACASMKSFKPKDGSDEDDGQNYHGQKRSNDTHESSTDKDARLFRKGKGKESRLCHMGHLLTENRNGLIVDTEVTPAGTSQEWDAGTSMLARQSTRPGMTVGADKGYDTGDFVEGCRGLKVTPHVAAKKGGSTIDGRTTSTEGYRISQVKRKRIEECFGWMKDIGLMRKVRHVGQEKISWIFRFTAAAYNITRMKTIMA